MQYKQRAGEEDDLDSIQAFTPILQSFSRDMSSESNPSLLLEAFPFVLEYDMCYKDDWVFLTLFNPQINQFGLESLGFACLQITRLLCALAHYQEPLRRNYNNSALKSL